MAKDIVDTQDARVGLHVFDDVINRVPVALFANERIGGVFDHLDAAIGDE
jgi:hypothetical protein